MESLSGTVAEFSLELGDAYEHGDPVLASGGHWYSATLSRACDGDGERVVKAFSETPWLFRQTFGRLCTGHEFRMLRALAGVKGAPQDVVRVSPYALSYEFVPGLNTRQARKHGQELDAAFFASCVELLECIHARGVVHLDLRNGDNIIRGEGGEPTLVDFQSSLSVGWLPSVLRRPLERIDFGGVYKHWSRLAPESMPAGEVSRVEREQRRSRWWVFNKWRLLAPLHKLFNNRVLRKSLLRLRVPLAIGALYYLFMHVGARLFWVGLAVSWIGEALQVWCFASLKKSKVLAWRGPYAVVRNPMYLGRFLILLGGILLLENIWITVAFSVLYYFYMVNRVKREEEKLSGIFGEDYQDYCQRIGRFLPQRFAVEDLKRVPYFEWALFKRNHAHWNILGTAAAWAALWLAVSRS